MSRTWALYGFVYINIILLHTAIKCIYTSMYIMLLGTVIDNFFCKGILREICVIIISLIFSAFRLLISSSMMDVTTVNHTCRWRAIERWFMNAQALLLMGTVVYSPSCWSKPVWLACFYPRIINRDVWAVHAIRIGGDSHFKSTMK